MSEQNPIDAILARLKASTAPSVNPSVAAQVLDTATRAEVANEPSPTGLGLAPLPAGIFQSSAAPAPAPAPATAPAPAPAPAGPVGGAEPKTRRTAAVVQQELDAALIRIAELEATRPCSGDVLQQTTEQLVAVLRERGYRVGLSAE